MKMEGEPWVRTGFLFLHEIGLSVGYKLVPFKKYSNIIEKILNYLRIDVILIKKIRS